jgi:hypothetical protein
MHLSTIHTTMPRREAVFKTDLKEILALENRLSLR